MDNTQAIELLQNGKADIESKVFDERIKILHQSLLVGIPANFISSLLIYFGLYRVEHHLVFLIWISAILLHSIIRFSQYFFYRKIPQRGKLHLILFLIGVTITGVLWGILDSLLMPPDVLHQLLIIIIVTAVTSAALQTLQASFVASVIFVTLNILPLCIWLALQKNYEYIVASIVMLTYLGFMLVISKRNYHLLMTTLKLKFENVELIKYLSQANKKLKNIAYHDSLTGLANRKLLQLLFDSAASAAQQYKKNMAICFLDLDNFKQINDVYGHYMGDEALIIVASRLKTSVRKTDIIARFGGDEFVLVITELSNPADVSKIINHLQEKFSQPFKAQDTLLNISLSIGVSFFPKDGKDLKTLINKADKALYQVKEGGGGNIYFYDEDGNKNDEIS